MGLTPERFVAIADNHGDKVDPTAEKALFDFIKHWNPKHRLHLGDAVDLRWLRSKASEEDRLDPNLPSDFDMGLDFIKRFNPTVFLMGNHDHRLVKGCQSHNPATKELCKGMLGDFEDALCGVKPVPYNKRTGVVPFGDRKLLHGYSAGIGAVRKHALCYGSMWMGHLHTIECVTVERDDNAEGRCIGGMCLQELGYNEGQIGTLRQQPGFLYGLIFPNGKTISWQAQSVDGTWYMPSEMQEVAA